MCYNFLLPITKETDQLHFIIGPFALDFSMRECRYSGETHRLSKMEFNVLKQLLVSYAYESAESLAENLQSSPEAIEQVIAEIRKKFGEDDIIETKRRVGYRLRI